MKIKLYQTLKRIQGNLARRRLREGLCWHVAARGNSTELLEEFLATATAVLGYPAKGAFWLLPLDGDGQYVVPTPLPGSNPEAPYYVHPTTNTSCFEAFVGGEILDEVRLKLIRDCITHLEGELNVNSKGNENDTEK